MASNDTAALVVALSAQLTRFEKDMNGAVTVADRSVAKIEARFAAANGVINNRMQQLTTSVAGNLGFAGSLLTALGPAGIAAAVGIGAAVAGVLALANASAEYATKSKLLKEASETAGLTITQFKLLGSAGKTVGLDFEETAAFFTKFLANLAQLRDGGGPLYDALLKIDVGLLKQLSVTKDSAQAIDLLVAAYRRLQDQTAKLDLSRAAGGRAGLSGGRLLETLGNQGGLAGLEAKSPPIDETQINRAAQLKTDMQEIQRATSNIWGGMFSDTILQNQRNAQEEIRLISQWISDIVAKTRSGVFGDDFNARFQFKPPQPTRVTVNPAIPGSAQTTTGSPSVELALLQRNLSLLGDAITQGEQWKLKRLEIAAAGEKGALMDGIAARSLAAFNLTLRAAALATRERLGVATEQQIVDVRLAQLQQDKIKFGLKENEVQAATVVILREAKLAAEALAVRQSYLPGLKQLEFDAASLSKNMDAAAVTSVNNLGAALGDIVTGSATASDAFRNLGLQVVRSITDMIIKMTILAPIAQALQSILSPGVPLAGSLPIGQGGIGARAGGGPVSSGMPYIIGEHGPEIMVPQSAGMVLPNGVMPRGTAGGDMSVTFSIDLKGANGDEAINRAVRQGVSQGMQQTLAIVNANAPGRQVKFNQLGT